MKLKANATTKTLGTITGDANLMQLLKYNDPIYIKKYISCVHTI